MTHATQMTLLSLVDWKKASRVAKREQSNREDYAPVVSTYRWWARRPHSVMGAILDAAATMYGPGELAVSDPFSGGGTVTFEAVRRSIKAYAQDLYPWPADGLATALEPTDLDALVSASKNLLAFLEPHRARYRCASGAELSHVIRVRVASCPDCKQRAYLFPEPRVSLASRSIREKFAFYGCRKCGSVTQTGKDVSRFKCTDCGDWHSTTTYAADECPHCNAVLKVDEAPCRNSDWVAVLAQEVVYKKKRAHARLRLVRQGDPVAQQLASDSIHPLRKPIREGIETKRLLKAGFRQWGDMYTERQAAILTDALTFIRALPCANSIKDRLAFAVIGCAELPAYLSRWDRFHLKPFEGIANHRYASTHLVVEMNPLSDVGRGTLPRRLAGCQKALRWLSKECGELSPVKRIGAWRQRPATDEARVVVATGSSFRQALPDESVQLVLTDPPFFDNVQYGELARIFHAWLALYRNLPAYDERQEAVPNNVRGVNAADYEHAITGCLRESRRTLTTNGRLVLTFHNKKLVAWQALAAAISAAGFTVSGVAVVRAENGADHCKRDVESLLDDVVLECVPRGRHPKSHVACASTPKSAAEKNLIAIGLAVADAINAGEPSRVADRYGRELAQMRVRRALIE